MKQQTIIGVIVGLVVGAASVFALFHWKGQSVIVPTPAPIQAPVQARFHPPAGVEISHPVKGAPWAKVCSKDKTGTEHCRAVQREITMPSKAVLMAVSVGHDAKGQVQLVFDLPLGIELPPGLGVKIGDKGKWLRLPISACMKNACVAVVVIDKGALKDLRTAKHMAVRYMAGGKPFEVPVNMDGFAKTLDSIGG